MQNKLNIAQQYIYAYKDGICMNFASRSVIKLLFYEKERGRVRRKKREEERVRERWREKVCVKQHHFEERTDSLKFVHRA